MCQKWSPDKKEIRELDENLKFELFECVIDIGPRLYTSTKINRRKQKNRREAGSIMNGAPRRRNFERPL